MSSNHTYRIMSGPRLPIKHIQGDKAPGWVGDGFFVKPLIIYVDDHPNLNYRHTDPFLLFDYGVPTVFEPNPQYQSQLWHNA
ncbi:hypothetical protein J6393_31015, partial [Pseudomonas aeruginosa]|nr:hypothetical protein [Pseudomonas aeruginosa]